VTTIILAAGQSKRMNAGTPKVLLEVEGRPLVSYVIDAAQAAGADRVILVVGTGRELVQAAMTGRAVEFAVQAEQRGTADAVLACRGLVGPDEEVVVLCGDAPLVTAGSIRRLREAREEAGADVAVFTAVLDEPGGYGRIVRRADGMVERIVERRDANPDELAVREVNSGAYSFRWDRVLPLLERVEPSSVSGEYYLTDIVALANRAGRRVVPVPAVDPREMMGANTPDELAAVAAVMAERLA
jgi:bifunctional UDP-N-acetylglucosamine pyrophosphorylase/glucosamine-1-phosphate N-acetyltransferase